MAWCGCASVFTCMCVFVHLCVGICVHVSVCTHLCACAHSTCVCAHRAGMCVNEHACMCAWARVCAHMCVRLCMCLCMRTLHERALAHLASYFLEEPGGPWPVRLTPPALHTQVGKPAQRPRARGLQGGGRLAQRHFCPASSLRSLFRPFGLGPLDPWSSRPWWPHLLGLREPLPCAHTAHPQPSENKQRKLQEQEDDGFRPFCLCCISE